MDYSPTDVLENLMDNPSRQGDQHKTLLSLVLLYLMEHGPMPLFSICLHFDKEGTERVGSALLQLAACKLISVEDTIATITQLGRDQLTS